VDDVIALLHVVFNHGELKNGLVGPMLTASGYFLQMTRQT